MAWKAIAAGFLLVLASSCGGSQSGSGSIAGADGGIPVNDGGGYGNLVAISLSQTDVHIAAGASTAFAVTGTYADGSRADVTPQAQASSSNTAVATVENGPGSQIQIHAKAAGTSTVTVTVGALSQTCKVTVAP
jgi:uncharacterized protein YjdB